MGKRKKQREKIPYFYFLRGKMRNLKKLGLGSFIGSSQSSPKSLCAVINIFTITLLLLLLVPLASSFCPLGMLTSSWKLNSRSSKDMPMVLAPCKLLLRKQPPPPPPGPPQPPKDSETLNVAAQTLYDYRGFNIPQSTFFKRDYLQDPRLALFNNGLDNSRTAPLVFPSFYEGGGAGATTSSKRPSIFGHSQHLSQTKQEPVNNNGNQIQNFQSQSQTGTGSGNNNQGHQFRPSQVDVGYGGIRESENSLQREQLTPRPQTIVNYGGGGSVRQPQPQPSRPLTPQQPQTNEGKEFIYVYDDEDYEEEDEEDFEDPQGPQKNLRDPKDNNQDAPLFNQGRSVQSGINNPILIKQGVVQTTRKPQNQNYLNNYVEPGSNNNKDPPNSIQNYQNNYFPSTRFVTPTPTATPTPQSAQLRPTLNPRVEIVPSADRKPPQQPPPQSQPQVQAHPQPLSQFPPFPGTATSGRNVNKDQEDKEKSNFPPFPGPSSRVHVNKDQGDLRGPPQVVQHHSFVPQSQQPQIYESNNNGVLQGPTGISRPFDDSDNLPPPPHVNPRPETKLRPVNTLVPKNRVPQEDIVLPPNFPFHEDIDIIATRRTTTTTTTPPSRRIVTNPPQGTTTSSRSVIGLNNRGEIIRQTIRPQLNEVTPTPGGVGGETDPFTYPSRFRGTSGPKLSNKVKTTFAPLRLKHKQILEGGGDEEEDVPVYLKPGNNRFRTVPPSLTSTTSTTTTTRRPAPTTFRASRVTTTTPTTTTTPRAPSARPSSPSRQDESESGSYEYYEDDEVEGEEEEEYPSQELEEKPRRPHQRPATRVNSNKSALRPDFHNRARVASEHGQGQQVPQRVRGRPLSTTTTSTTTTPRSSQVTLPRKKTSLGKPLYFAGKMLAKEGGLYAGHYVPPTHNYGDPFTFQDHLNPNPPPRGVRERNNSPGIIFKPTSNPQVISHSMVTPTRGDRGRVRNRERDRDVPSSTQRPSSPSSTSANPKSRLIHPSRVRQSTVGLGGRGSSISTTTTERFIPDREVNTPPPQSSSRGVVIKELKSPTLLSEPQTTPTATTTPPVINPRKRKNRKKERIQQQTTTRVSVSSSTTEEEVEEDQEDKPEPPPLIRKNAKPKPRNNPNNNGRIRANPSTTTVRTSVTVEEEDDPPPKITKKPLRERRPRPNKQKPAKLLLAKMTTPIDDDDLGLTVTESPGRFSSKFTGSREPSRQFYTTTSVSSSSSDPDPEEGEEEDVPKKSFVPKKPKLIRPNPNKILRPTPRNKPVSTKKPPPPPRPTTPPQVVEDKDDDYAVPPSLRLTGKDVVLHRKPARKIPPGSASDKLKALQERKMKKILKSPKDYREEVEGRSHREDEEGVEVQDFHRTLRRRKLLQVQEEEEGEEDDKGPAPVVSRRPRPGPRLDPGRRQGQGQPQQRLRNQNQIPKPTPSSTTPPQEVQEEAQEEEVEEEQEQPVISTPPPVPAVKRVSSTPTPQPHPQNGPLRPRKRVVVKPRRIQNPQNANNDQDIQNNDDPTPIKPPSTPSIPINQNSNNEEDDDQDEVPIPPRRLRRLRLREQRERRRENNRRNNNQRRRNQRLRDPQEDEGDHEEDVEESRNDHAVIQQHEVPPTNIIELKSPKITPEEDNLKGPPKKLQVTMPTSETLPSLPLEKLFNKMGTDKGA